MSVHLRPVGPLPPPVYWRRRLVALVLLALAVLVLRGVVGGVLGDDDPADTLAVEGAPEVLEAPAPTPAPDATAAPAPPPTPSAAPPPACADADLTVTATTDVETYELGQTPQLTLSVLNAGAAPCTRDVGPGAVELRVLSGEDRIWSSDDCAPGGDPGPTVLAPGEPVTTELPWAGRRSLPECSGPMDRARPGTYRVVARVGELEVEGAVFRVTVG